MKYDLTVRVWGRNWIVSSRPHGLRFAKLMAIKYRITVSVVRNQEEVA